MLTTFIKGDIKMTTIFACVACGYTPCLFHVGLIGAVILTGVAIRYRETIRSYFADREH